jgi:purine catabolism regulator
MPTTVRHLLDEPALSVDLVVDGDLDRPIRWVHVAELSDPSPYLVGEEFLLTTGMWRRRGTSALDFVQSLVPRKVAGIGYGLLATEERVPPALVRACRTEGIPLIAVRVETPFLAVSQWFVDRLTEERESHLRGTLDLTAELLAAADIDSTGTALASVARLLGRSIGREVWILDSDGRRLAWARVAPDEETARNLSAATGDDASYAAREVDLLHRGTWRVRSLVSGRRRTAILAVQARAEDLDTRARTDAAVPIVGLILARERAVREAGRRISGEVVSLVLSRQDELAAVRLGTFDLGRDQSMVVLVCHVRDGEEALSRVERWRDEAGLNGVLALRGAELFAILEGGAVVSAPGPRVLARALASRSGASATGVSVAAEGVRTLRRAIVQAQQSCALAQRHGGGAVFSNESRGTHGYLMALQDRDDVEEFRHTLLGVLEQYDKTHDAALVASLRTFLANGARWQQTAAMLHIHVNTLRHRLARVEQLTGRRLELMSDRVDFWLALQASRTEP